MKKRIVSFLCMCMTVGIFVACSPATPSTDRHSTASGSSESSSLVSGSASGDESENTSSSEESVNEDNSSEESSSEKADILLTSWGPKAYGEQSYEIDWYQAATGDVYGVGKVDGQTDGKFWTYLKASGGKTQPSDVATPAWDRVETEDGKYKWSEGVGPSLIIETGNF